MLLRLQQRSVDEAEVAQRFCFLGVLSVLDQERSIGPIYIALGRAHHLLNAFDSVAVPLPNFGVLISTHN